MKRLLSLLGLALTIALSSHAAYYIVGSNPFGDWNPADGVQMTPQSDGTYTCKATINGTIWFVFADGLSADWGVFNSTYRIGPLNGDQTVELYTYVTTQRAGDSGAYKFTGSGEEYTITLNPNTWQFIIEGIYTPPPVTTYTVAGSSEALFGTTWNPTNIDNDMEKLADGTYRWQKCKVALEQGSFEFKIVANHDWGFAYPADNYHVEVPKADNYDVEIRFNPSTEEITCSITLAGGGGPSLYGDLNGDGEINIADVNVLIDAILSGNMNMEYDVNGDREINIADVSALIDVLLSPDPKDLQGMISLEWSEEGDVWVEYTGRENVTIKVILNGEEIELVDGYFQLRDQGENLIEVIVSAYGFNSLIESFIVYWIKPIPVQTASPEIYVELTEDYAIITAVGEGEVILYINGIEVENPFCYMRGSEDVEIIIAATAQGEGMLISEPAYMEFVVPAMDEPLEQTPMPEITCEVNEDVVVIDVLGLGETHLYINGEEVEIPYFFERGEEDFEIEVMATAQQEGMLVSEPTICWIVVPAKENVDPDPHMVGCWLVLYDRDGSELWYELQSDGYSGYSTVVSLHYAVFGDFDEDGGRVNVPFHFVVDGVNYGPYVDKTTPVFGSAVDNPLFEGSNNFVAPVGYPYNVGIVDDVFSGMYYLMITQGFPLPQY